MTQLHCIPTSLWSWNYGIETPQGTATVEFNFLKDEGEIALPDTTYSIQHPMLSGEWLLKQGQDVQDSIAQARKPNPLQRKIELTYGTETLTLQAVSPFRRKFQICQDNQIGGYIRPANFLSRQATMPLCHY